MAQPNQPHTALPRITDITLQTRSPISGSTGEGGSTERRRPSGVLARGAFWVGVVLCGVALGGCSGSTSGPVQPTAAKLAFIVQPSNAVAGVANTPAVQVAVQDAQGNTVTTATTSITLAIGTNPASGTLAGTKTVGAVNGVATFSTLSLNLVGTGYTLTASGSGLTGAASNAFNIYAGAGAKVVFTVQPSNAGAGAMNTPAVQVAVQDAQGNTVTTATTSITLAIGTNPASGTLSGTKTVAAVNGVATFSTLSLNAVGTGYTLTAAATGLTGATSTAFNISVGAAAKLVFTVQPSNAAAGAAVTPALQVGVQDAQGNTVTTATTSITLAIGTNPASGILAGTKTVAAVNGVASFANLSINNSGTGYTLTATATALTGATSSGFNIGVGAAAKLVFTVQPSTAAAGAAITPAMQVAVQDAQGNTVTTATTSISLAIGSNSASGTLAGTTTVAAVNGVASFANLSINNPGTGYTLIASATGLPTATSTAFSINAGAAAKLVFAVQPSNTAAGAAITPGVQVAVQDAQGNAVTTATTSITVAIGTNPASGTLAGTATVAAVNGVATFSNLSIDKAGTGYTLTASATGLTGATSSAFNVIVVVVAPVSLSAGADHTCGVARSGAAYCWGSNPYGEAGDGTYGNNRLTPVAVSGGLTFAAVSGGSYYTCGVTTRGAAYCWGLNNYGQGGNGTTTFSSLTPVAVSGGLTFTAVSTSDYHTCGVTTSGTAYCWGWNNTGGLGDGTSGTDRLTPVAVSGGLTFAAVSTSDSHSCGVTPSGAAYCWGSNAGGALGNGTTTGSLIPVAVSGGLTFAAVSAGTRYTCGLTPSGAAYCWGDNGYGVLGNGTTTSSTTPVAVSGGLTFAAVSAGFINTCGVTTSGAAYCWGSNGSGELGNGTTTRSATPVAVSGGLTLAAVSVGGSNPYLESHTCGVTPGGAAYCWGYNRYGQLGDGTGGTERLTPVAVLGGLTF